jgi:hypothetical protein
VDESTPARQRVGVYSHIGTNVNAHAVAGYEALDERQFWI